MKRPLNLLIAALTAAIVVVMVVLLQGDGAPTADRLPPTRADPHAHA
ncbi:MAG: hypothetical protein O2884_12845 [Chloroflexi bacterium]|nr:hypothetical protein [Chloroflexota bacterium]